jgi:hypothetical protein
MTTENERVAGYIIPEVYDRFEEFCKENNLTCSRGLNVILAEYFGMEETLIFKQTWAGGVTLPEFEKLKQEVQELKQLVNTLSNVQSITPQNKQLDEQINKEIEKQINEQTNEGEGIIEEIPEKISKKIKEKINQVLSETINQSNNEEITLKLNTTELAKRFKLSRASINTYKRKFRENKISKEEYIEWTRSQDPEGKGWFFDEKINYSV